MTPSPRSNLWAGIAAATVGALVGATLWAVLVTVTDYKIGYAAIGVGALAGFLAGRFGGGDPRLPYLAAVIGVIGCVIGDLFGDAHAVSVALGEEGISASSFEVLRKMVEHPDFGWEIYRTGFAGMDLLFYAFAGYAGLRLAAQHGAAATAPAVLTDPAAGPAPWATPETTPETAAAPTDETAAATAVEPTPEPVRD